MINTNTPWFGVQRHRLADISLRIDSRGVSTRLPHETFLRQVDNAQRAYGDTDPID
jgi:hypothetical protein